MSTYGEIRHRLQLLFPGVHEDIRDGAIDDRYFAILDQLPWERLRVDSILQTTAKYDTGTVEVTEGSTAVTGAGTTWTAAMSGRAFRVTGRSEVYEFTQTGAGSGTLDRAYEGDSDTDAGYTIYQDVYPLPADCRFLDGSAFCDFSLGTLNRLSRGQMAEQAPSYGTPRYWALYMDDASDPPRMQVKFHPAPDAVLGIPFSYYAEKAALSAGTTSAALLPFVRPSALIHGASADIRDHLKDYAGAEFSEKKFAAALEQMVMNEARRMGPVTMQLGDHYTSHRVRRWSR